MDYNKLFHTTYKGKKVFLTGHTGFKGSWLLTWLFQSGAIVKGYALAAENKDDLYNMVGGDELCSSVIADIRDKDRLNQEITSFQPDFIFHLAAQPLVRQSYEMPLYTYEVNVNGTAHVLEALRELQSPCTVIIITTDKVYENRETHYAYRENDKLGGYDPYSASKAAAEIVVSSYRNSFFNPASFENHHKAIATARAGNVIGGGDRAKDRIIPDIIRSLEQGKPVVIRNPDSIRPWQHVLEPLSGYLLLGARLKDDPLKFGDAWNFGPQKENVLTVKEIADEVFKIWNGGEYVTPPLHNEPHEAGLLKLDISKAVNLLSWNPEMNLETTIRKTVQWYKNASPSTARQLTLQQISEYQQAS